MSKTILNGSASRRLPPLTDSTITADEARSSIQRLGRKPPQIHQPQRGGPSIESTEMAEGYIPNLPVDGLAPRRHASAEDWEPRPPQDLDPFAARLPPRSALIFL